MGSAVFMQSSAVDITNSLFHDNETRSSIGNSSEYFSSSAIYYAGGPQLYTSNTWTGAKAFLINNTIANNLATSAKSNSNITSGIYYNNWETGSEGLQPTIYAFNNIIYGNKDGSEIEQYQLQFHGQNVIFHNDYNLISNLDNLKNGSGAGQDYFSYDYSIDADPGFKDLSLIHI